MKKKKIRSLIIGLGKVGLDYDYNNKYSTLSHCKSINDHPNYELIAGVDLDKTQCIKFFKKYKKAFYNNYEEAIKKHNPELVVVSVPTECHLNIIKKIIKYKCIKTILLEKPGTYSTKNLKKIFDLCNQNKIKLFLNYLRLYDQYFIDIANKLKKNNNLNIFIFYSRGIYNNCSHYLSFLGLFLKEIKKIKILKRYNEKKKDYSADFYLKYKNADVYFFKNKTDKISHSEIIINTENGSWRSSNNFKEFNYLENMKDEFIKDNITYSNQKEILNQNKFTLQYLVYDKIFKDTKINKTIYKKNSMTTLKNLEKIINMIK